MSEPTNQCVTHDDYVIKALEDALTAERAKVADAQLRATNILRLCEEREAALRAAEAKVARLLAALEEAPHAEGCASHGLRYASQIEQYCDCFKSVLRGEER